MTSLLRIELGRLGRAVGLRGELKLIRGPDFWPESLGSARLTLVSASGGDERPTRVLGSRDTSRSLIVRLDGIADRAAAEALRDTQLVLNGELDVAPPDSPRPFQVRGMSVRHGDGEEIGTVSDLELAPAQPLLVVRDRRTRKEHRIPWVEPIVQQVDWEKGTIEVDPPDGLLEL